MAGMTPPVDRRYLAGQAAGPTARHSKKSLRARASTWPALGAGDDGGSLEAAWVPAATAPVQQSQFRNHRQRSTALRRKARISIMVIACFYSAHPRRHGAASPPRAARQPLWRAGRRGPPLPPFARCSTLAFARAGWRPGGGASPCRAAARGAGGAAQSSIQHQQALIIAPSSTHVARPHRAAASMGPRRWRA